MKLIAQAAPAAQTTAATTTTTTEPAPAAAEGTPPPQGGMGSTLIFIVLLFGIFYFMMIRPQQRKEKERQKMIAELRAGRKVSFAGGLIGTIKEAREQTFLIELCPGTTVEVARGAVAAAIAEPAAEGTK